MFEFITTSDEHNDGGANCFISNDLSHFTSYTPRPLQIKQLDGSKASALGFGLKLIQCPTTKSILPLWPTYYMPSNPQCTFSPTALKHYLHLPTVTTNHLHSLVIVTSDGLEISFPSLKQYATTKLLDYHRFHIIRPCNTSVIPFPSVSSATTETRINRNILHQRFCHGCDEVLDIMCRKQSVLGLPKRAFPNRTCPCIICTTAKMTSPPKAKVSSYRLTKRGQLLQIDFSFWNVTSLRGFSSLLSVIDGKDRMLWVFPTASKRPPS